jgi:hypothetical protein
MSIKNAIIDTTPTTLFKSGFTTVNSDNVIISMYFCNASVGTVTFNLYVVPSGKTADPINSAPLSSESNIVYYAVQVGASDTFVIDTERLMLNYGDSIVATASQANCIVATISFMEM